MDPIEQSVLEKAIVVTSALALEWSHFKVLGQSFYVIGNAVSVRLSCTLTGIISQRDNLCDFLYASQYDRTSKMGLLCTTGRKFFKSWPLMRGEAKMKSLKVYQYSP